MIEDKALVARAAALIAAYAAAKKTVATAESCTGGLVAGLLTAVPGSSAVFDRGFVTYSDAAKAEAIGVPSTLIATHGAVSEKVARAMAEGALRSSRADVAVSLTGVAGPGGGSTEKPVGLVHIGLAIRKAPTRHREMRFGDAGRSEIRQLAVGAAIEILEEAIAVGVQRAEV